jgi:hypothetical protein
MNNDRLSFSAVALLLTASIAATLGVIATGAGIARHFEHQDCMVRHEGYSFAASLCAERVYGDD